MPRSRGNSTADDVSQEQSTSRLRKPGLSWDDDDAATRIYVAPTSGGLSPFSDEAGPGRDTTSTTGVTRPADLEQVRALLSEQGQRHDPQGRPAPVRVVVAPDKPASGPVRIAPSPHSAAASQDPDIEVDVDVDLDEVTRAGPQHPTVHIPAQAAKPARRPILAWMAVLLIASLAVLSLGMVRLLDYFEPGSVALTTEPGDAIVRVDGKLLDATSPFVITGISPRDLHLIQIEKQGYRSWSQQVQVQPRQKLEIDVTLQREQAEEDAALVQAVLEPADALNGLPVEPLPSEAAEPARTGDESAAQTQEAAHAARRLAARARPVPNTTGGAEGTLRINSRPWAQVYIDGKLVGNTPQMNLPLPVGSHRIRLNNPELKLQKSLTVDIQANQAETHIVDLEPIPQTSSAAPATM